MCLIAQSLPAGLGPAGHHPRGPQSLARSYKSNIIEWHSYQSFLIFGRLNMGLIKPVLIPIFSLLLTSCMYGNPRDISKLPGSAFTSKNTGLVIVGTGA